MIPVLCLLFVLSGAAGLIYESIWTRYLGLFVGHDAYAQIVVLVIFLGGMSAGAMVVSRWGSPDAESLAGLCAGGVRRRRHRARVPRCLRLRPPTSPTTPCIRPWPARPPFPLAKWALASAMILPQSILLGATFPLMSARRPSPQPRRGRAEALRSCTSPTASARPPASCVAGFYLVALAGLPGTLVTAAMLNLAVGVLTIGAGAASPAPGRSRPRRQAARRADGPGPPSAPVSSGCSLAPHSGPRWRPSSTRSPGSGCCRWCWAARPIRSSSCCPPSSSASRWARFWIRGRADRCATPARTLGIVQWVMGMPGAGHPAALRGLVRVGGLAARDVRPIRPGLRRVHRGALRDSAW